MYLLSLRTLSVPIASRHVHASDPIKNWNVKRARAWLYIADACCVCRLRRWEQITITKHILKQRRKCRVTFIYHRLNPRLNITPNLIDALQKAFWIINTSNRPAHARNEMRCSCRIGIELEEIQLHAELIGRL